MELHFSIIVPVFDRPDEMVELLESLSLQTDTDFEVVVMEGECKYSCRDICKRYSSTLNIKYFQRPTGRSERRNEGMQLASGNYFILFDSDCIIPKNYIKTLRKTLTSHYLDCFGGPDSADCSFSNLQLAVNFSMTSFFTTGGIRGGMKNVKNYLPRAFNMGFSREVFNATGGYADMIGEDVDLSMRIKEMKFSVELIPQAVVVHKRRVTLKTFYKQVNTFGKARIVLSRKHAGSLKLIHCFPTLFFLGNLLLIVMSVAFCRPWIVAPIALYVLLLFVESLVKNRSLKVALLSVITAYIQLCGYGIGFIDELVTKRASKKTTEKLYRQK